MKIYITVSGGMVCSVYADEEVDVTVVDYDNAKIGDEDAIENDQRLQDEIQNLIPVY